jgi:endonuclease III
MSTRQKLRTRREAIKILDLIRNTIRDKTALEIVASEEDSTPFKVLISTMLSARTRDPVTNEAAARLFKFYPDSKSLSRARALRVRKLIYPVSFYRVKAKRIIEVARIIEQKHQGKTPETMEDLLDLPGVGRKTANCVLVYAYSTPAIPVDVHVHRISNRIGIVRTKTPEQTEIELSGVYDRKYWLPVNELFVSFGKAVCKPVAPRCGICDVKKHCNYYQNLVEKGKRPASA